MIHPAKRNILLKPMVAMRLPLVVSPSSSPKFMTLMSMENSVAPIFLLVMSMHSASRMVNNAPLSTPSVA